MKRLGACVFGELDMGSTADPFIQRSCSETVPKNAPHEDRRFSIY